MFKFLKNAASGELVLGKPVEDYIPYACHYTPDTILTKNGELLQVIKITGFAQENIGAQHRELREMIRHAVRDHIKDESYAIWLHTVRKKKDLRLRGAKYPSGFSQKTHEAWDKLNTWQETYVNEVYLTILRDGVHIKITTLKHFLRSLSFSKLNKWHEGYLNKAHKELSKVTNGMLESLQQFGARRLGLMKRNEVVYSEPLQFFSKILNLAEKDMPLLPINLSALLVDYKIAFGFNTMEVLSRAGKRFGALFSVKEYHELPTRSIDDVLQLPQEFIITQTLDFINSSRALGYFAEQKRIVDASHDEYYYKVSGLKNVMESNKGSPTDYGEGQISMMVLSDSTQELDTGIERIVEALSKLGIVVTRRDLRMEEMYWAQLPGNFAYLSRKRPIDTERIGGFASIMNDPAGSAYGNHWGDAVTLFKTASGTPHFFNFHHNSSGHTAIMGPHGSGKTVLLNFLVSESMKFNGKLFYFDYHGASKTFIESMGGQYMILEQGAPFLHPLLLENSPKHISFLAEWIALLAGKSQESLDQRQKAVLQKAAEYLLKLPVQQRTLERILPGLEQAGLQEIVSELKSWCGQGSYAKWIRGQAISPALTKKVYGFGVGELSKDLRVLAPQLAFMFHMVEQALDGKPAIIVLDEAWKLVNNKVFLPKLTNFLKRVTQKNGIVIFSTENVTNASESQITPTIVDAITTKIFLPNKTAEQSSKAYKEVWKLNSKEFDMLASMQVEKRQFMLKNPTEAIVATLDLDGLDALPILSGAVKNDTMS